MFQLIKSFALLGGEWVLAVMLGLSLWAMAVAWNRHFHFKNRGRHARDLDVKLPPLLEKGDHAASIALCREAVCAEASVVLSGLEALPRGREAAEQAMESRRLGERLEMERHLLVLGTLGNNIPFVGLFGTVLGIIKAFNDLALAGTAGPTGRGGGPGLHRPGAPDRHPHRGPVQPLPGQGAANAPQRRPPFEDDAFLHQKIMRN